MGPAIWVRGIGGLVSAEGAARVAIQPDREPSAGLAGRREQPDRQRYWGMGLAAAIGQRVKVCAAIGGDRYAGDDDGPALTPRESL